MQATAWRAGVAVEFRRRGAAGEQQVGKAIAAAIECRDAAADHVFPLTAIDAVDSSSLGLLDETRQQERFFGHAR